MSRFQLPQGFSIPKVKDGKVYWSCSFSGCTVKGTLEQMSAVGAKADDRLIIVCKKHARLAARHGYDIFSARSSLSHYARHNVLLRKYLEACEEKART